MVWGGKDINMIEVLANEGKRKILLQLFAEGDGDGAGEGNGGGSEGGEGGVERKGFGLIVM